MEDKVFELLSKMYSEMQEGFKKIDKIEQDVESLKEGQKEIKSLISELDPKNANRHVELTEKIDELRKDLSTVEIVTANNYAALAKLKAVK
jgi:polyhydroxyalkanoate synthesis regulator phasin